MKQTRVADHAVVQQLFVTGRRLAVSELVIVEFEAYRACANGRARNLSAHLDSDSFLGLDMENQIIRRDRICFVDGKKRERRCLEAENDGCSALRQPFSGT